MRKSILEQFNSKDSLLVISAYPKRNEIYSKGVCAVSSFAKNTILKLKNENPGRKIVILTIELGGKKTYVEDGILIIRCFKRNSPLSFIALTKEILRFNKIKDVMIEFEFASFGDTLTTSLVAPFSILLFLLRRNLLIVIHQVLFNIKDLSGHIGIKSNNLKLKVLNFGLKWFYFILGQSAKKIIVLEEEFKTRLSKVTDSGKIHVVSHGVDTNIETSNTKNIRKRFKIKNDEFVILYFGYLTWYKGVDFLIESLRNQKSINGKKVKLIIAGGPSFTQEQKTHYQGFITRINNLIKDSTNVLATGFVKEEDISPIFKASDLVVLPYRIFMSSSGPLSLAISHQKPFIISQKLQGLTKSKDFKEALEEANLRKSNIVFDLNKKSLIHTIAFSMEPKTSKKMHLFSKLLKEKRAFENIAKYYEFILYSMKERVVSSYKLVSSKES